MTPDDLETGTSETSDINFLAEGEDDPNPEADNTVSDPEDTSEDSSEDSSDDSETDEVESDSDDSDDEDEEEEESPEEEDEEEEEPSNRLSWKLIKEKHPDLAKDKDFREMFHREKAFSDLFPTVEDARESAQKAELLEGFDKALAEGNVSALVSSLNEPTLAKFTDQILPALAQVDQKLFFRATRPVMIQMLQSAMKRGLDTKEVNLVKSVRNISKYLFDSYELPEMGNNKLAPEVENEIKNLKAEQDKLLQTTKVNFATGTDRSIGKKLRAAISEGLDPKNELSDFVKDSIIEKTLNDTKATLLKDEAFVGKIRSIFKAAEKAGYPPDFRPRLISAYLGRAKNLALTLRAKHKSAAIGKKAANPKNRIESKPSKDNNNSQNSNRKDSSTKKMSDMDIIMDGVR